MGQVGENETDSNISEQTFFEEEISKLIEDQYLFTETIYASLPIGIEIYDAEGLLRSVNDYALRMYGIADRATVVGTVNLFNSPYMDDTLKAQVKNGEKISLEFEYDFDQINSDAYFSSSNKSTMIYNVQVVAIRG